MSLPLTYTLFDWLAGAALASARLAPVFFMLPFLNSGVLTGVVRQSAIVVVALGLWPHVPQALAGFDPLALLWLAAGEVLVGMVLACLLAWPFWLFHAAGSFIDNQRGATLSSSIDPANGVDTSELANFFNLFAAVVYLEGGGLRLMLELVEQSYRLCDPLAGCRPQVTPLLDLLTDFMAQAIVLASPVVAALLLSEVALGLLSRFAPQMNAFSVALTVKSAAAFFILLLYFGAVLPSEVLALVRGPEALVPWLSAGER